jgi:hypothetical protein
MEPRRRYRLDPELRAKHDAELAATPPDVLAEIAADARQIEAEFAHADWEAFQIGEGRD